MNNIELKEYIKNYLENDRTHSAIMLTGGWGSGKSYFVQNELIPYLNQDNPNRCVVVSLYGVSDTSDISKNVYLELRTQSKPVQTIKKISERILKRKHKEVMAYGKMVGSTLFRGLFNRGGIDLNSSYSDLKRLYTSVDLNGKLIILEDIERSQLGILDLLGYVNSLVEQDDIKVLLVANESEILKYEEKESNATDSILKVLTKESVSYLQTKEKTISDTIVFRCDRETAIKNIILSFENEQLNMFSTPEHIEDISSLFTLFNYDNLRSFVFACQKTIDIYAKIGDGHNFENLCCIFYGIIAFSKHIKSGAFPAWKGTEYLSTELGLSTHPLYRFCYDYIRWQFFDSSKVSCAFEEHKKSLLYSKNGGKRDPDLNFLGSWSVHTEDEVLNVLRNIENRLKNSEDIPFYQYGDMVVYFIKFNSILNFDYSLCKSRMITNIKGRFDDVDGELLFLHNDKFDSEKEAELYESFKNEILTSLYYKPDIESQFEYTPEELQEYYHAIVKEKDNIKNTRQFISKYDVDKLLAMIMSCDGKQLHDFRSILFAVYRNATYASFIENDVETMSLLAEKLENKKENDELPPDRILRHQIGWLIQNLRDFIKQISE